MIIKNKKITDENELKEIIEEYNQDNFVVKPEGLTAGKGVKVGGIHFDGKDEGYEYAKECLKNFRNSYNSRQGRRRRIYSNVCNGWKACSSNTNNIRLSI